MESPFTLPQTAAEWIAVARRRIAENGGPFDPRRSQRPPPAEATEPRALRSLGLQVIASTGGERPYHWVCDGSGSYATMPAESLTLEPDFPIAAGRTPPRGLPAIGQPTTVRVPGPAARRLEARILAYSPDGRWAWAQCGGNRPFTVPAEAATFAP